MRFLILLAFAASVILGATTTTAQSIALEPLFGSVHLTGGFEDDPHTVSLVAGGTNEVSNTIGTCAFGGWVADAPDYNLHYTATDGGWTLSIGAISDGDTIILVNLPDGSWACDDDSFEDLDPILSFSNPQSGLYNIWVGTVGEDTEPAELVITELYDN